MLLVAVFKFGLLVCRQVEARRVRGQFVPELVQKAQSFLEWKLSEALLDFWNIHARPPCRRDSSRLQAKVQQFVQC